MNADWEKKQAGLTSAPFTYPKADRYTIAIKAIAIFGNDTRSLMPVTVG